MPITVEPIIEIKHESIGALTIRLTHDEARALTRRIGDLLGDNRVVLRLSNQLQAEATTGEVVTGDGLTPEKVQEVTPSSPEPASAETHQSLGPLPRVKARIQFRSGPMSLWCEIFKLLASGTSIPETARQLNLDYNVVLSLATSSAVRFLNHAETLDPVDCQRYIHQVIDAQKARCEYHGVDFWRYPVGKDEPSNDHQVPEPVQSEPKPAPESNDRQVKPGLKIPGWSAETVAKVIDLVRTDPHMTIGILFIEWEKEHGYQFSAIEKDDLRAYWNDIKKEAAR